MLVNIGVRTNGCQEIALSCTDRATRDRGIGKPESLSSCLCKWGWRVNGF